MATIDNLDLSIYNLYAMRTRMVEQVNQQFQLDQYSKIPPHIQVLDNVPKANQIDLLLGAAHHVTPWAFFFPPLSFRKRRRSPFGHARILPSFGDQEEQEEKERAVAMTVCDDEEEERERETIVNCFKQVTKINGWLGHVLGRVGQFLKG